MMSSRFLWVLFIFVLYGALPNVAMAEKSYVVAPIQIMAERLLSIDSLSSGFTCRSCNSGCHAILKSELTSEALTQILHSELQSAGVKVAHSQAKILQIYVLEFNCLGADKQETIAAPLMLYYRTTDKSTVRALIQAEVRDPLSGEILRSFLVRTKSSNELKNHNSLFFQSESQESVAYKVLFQDAFRDIVERLGASPK